MQTLRQYVDVSNGSVHVALPESFAAQRVELIILSADRSDTASGDFRQFLLDSPEMADEEYLAIEAKRQHLNRWN
jgi:hypothetical protein